MQSILRMMALKIGLIGFAIVIALGTVSAQAEGGRYATNVPCVADPLKTASSSPRIQTAPIVDAPAENGLEWASQGGKAMFAPSIVTIGADRLSLAVFDAGTDRHLWWRRVGRPEAKWIDLGGGVLLTSAPSCVSQYKRGQDRIDCFVVGSDFSVWKMTLRSKFSTGWATLGEPIQSNGWDGWTRLGGESITGVSAVLLDGANGTDDAVALFALDTEGALWATRGTPPLIKDSDYSWGGWEKISDTGPNVLKTGPACLTDPAHRTSDNIICEVPTVDRLQEIAPFADISKLGNHISASYPIHLLSTPSFVSSGHMLVYRTDHDSLSLVTRLGVEDDKPAETDLGIVAKSAPSCTSMGGSDDEPTFACAVRGEDSAIWVRMFQLVN